MKYTLYASVTSNVCSASEWRKVVGMFIALQWSFAIIIEVNLN
jgi:hypothetical protein